MGVIAALQRLSPPDPASDPGVESAIRLRWQPFQPSLWQFVWESGEDVVVVAQGTFEAVQEHRGRRIEKFLVLVAGFEKSPKALIETSQGIIPDARQLGAFDRSARPPCHQAVVQFAEPRVGVRAHIAGQNLWAIFH